MPVKSDDDIPEENTNDFLHRFRIDENVRNELISHASQRLRALTHQMLKTYLDVRRWEQTDDVLQNALLRLSLALEATKPETASHFHRLAALQIRRELMDLARHHRGPLSEAANHHSDGEFASDTKSPLYQQASDPKSGSPDTWLAFHEAVEGMSHEEREVIDLLVYGGQTQDEAAALLNVSVRTLKRRWQTIRLKFSKALV